MCYRKTFRPPRKTEYKNNETYPNQTSNMVGRLFQHVNWFFKGNDCKKLPRGGLYCKIITKQRNLKTQIKSLDIANLNVKFH